MEIRTYSSIRLSDYFHQFFSEGPTGRFEIRIRFAVLDDEMYNLSFGVWDATTEQMDDLFETRNGDMDMILATVASVVLEFLAGNNRATVLACGSSESRTRKYQMSIARYLQVISNSYKVLGLVAESDRKSQIIRDFAAWKGRWENFRKGVNYDAFLIYLR